MVADEVGLDSLGRRELDECLHERHRLTGLDAFRASHGLGTADARRGIDAARPRDEVTPGLEEVGLGVGPEAPGVGLQGACGCGCGCDFFARRGCSAASAQYVVGCPR